MMSGEEFDNLQEGDTVKSKRSGRERIVLKTCKKSQTITLQKVKGRGITVYCKSDRYNFLSKNMSEIKRGVKVVFRRLVGNKKCHMEGIVEGIQLGTKRTVRITNVTSDDCITDTHGIYREDISNVIVNEDFVTKEMREYVKVTMDSVFKLYKNHPELIHKMGYRISKINEYGGN